jgi:hypothetical protein
MMDRRLFLVYFDIIPMGLHRFDNYRFRSSRYIRCLQAERGGMSFLHVYVTIQMSTHRLHVPANGLHDGARNALVKRAVHSENT